MLDTIANNLRDLPLRELQPRSGQAREAAVLLALTSEPEPRLVLTRRAAHLNDHAGEVALPGGMWEAEDSSLLHTALRESHEEMALPPQDVKPIATLPIRKTRYGVRVTPYVGIIPAGLSLAPELAELDAVFRVPLPYLLDKNNLVRDQFPVAGEEYWLPCYHFAGYRIWGFTLAILVDFLNKALAADLELVYPAVKQAAATTARK